MNFQIRELSFLNFKTSLVTARHSRASLWRIAYENRYVTHPQVAIVRKELEPVIITPTFIYSNPKKRKRISEDEENQNQVYSFQNIIDYFDKKIW